ncbi:type II toxin-antitoxin system VapB family antitoxin [Methylobacterium aquaticum]|jgi:antitoxin VapB|uniref:type II toxin-antitoxin system VapB family antitoxin n=1 Tax=Methylobacterium aquaticum TaxID=270351 RepID=UPI001FEE12E7|nr:type II toxin-antitoxin system VapB family antitoxin [Methylobacterium aquaticum]
MALFVKDPEVGALAQELASLKRTTTTTTEAVRLALRAEIEREKDHLDLVARLRAGLARAGRPEPAARRQGVPRRIVRRSLMFVDASAHKWIIAWPSRLGSAHM